MTAGSFWIPFFNLGVDEKGLLGIETALLDARPTDCLRDFHHSKTELSIERKSSALEAGSGIMVLKAYVDEFLETSFGAGSIQMSTLLHMDCYRQAQSTPKLHSRGILGNLEIGAVTVAETVRMLRLDLRERRRSGLCLGLLTPLKLGLGIFDRRVMLSMRALGRSNMWQSQIESVQLVSANYLCVTLQIFPVIGVFVGKLVQYLNEHPTWVTTVDQARGSRSLRWSGGKHPDLRPSVRLVLLYLISWVKLMLLMAAVFAGRHLMALAAIFVVAGVEGLIGAFLPEHNRLRRCTDESKAAATAREGEPNAAGPSRELESKSDNLSALS